MDANISELVSLLFAVGRSMRESMRRVANGKGASFLQFETLRYVKEHDRPHMRDVAGYFRITPPAATLLVDGLVREGLLTRVFDRRDRRAVRLTLTPQGLRYLTQGKKAHLRRITKLFSVLDARERRQAIAILKKMAKNIEP
ncbi:MAG TPA: MarR family transcriptional regulator [Candidatus Paceibacterota bacterium]|nr:MarR family transcriptional regulator [Candidatus Paceibacterota bacterium]